MQGLPFNIEQHSINMNLRPTELIESNAPFEQQYAKLVSINQGM
jgi:hypothetical protein